MLLLAKCHKARNTSSEQFAGVILMGKIQSHLLDKWVQYTAVKMNEPTWLFSFFFFFNIYYFLFRRVGIPKRKLYVLHNLMAYAPTYNTYRSNVFKALINSHSFKVSLDAVEHTAAGNSHLNTDFTSKYSKACTRQWYISLWSLISHILNRAYSTKEN